MKEQTRMAFYGNLCKKLADREILANTNIALQRRSQVTPDLIRRIGLETELTGHTGCVNCLEWNEKGSLLASGSDDVQVILWDPFKHKAITTIRTGHHGNIFSVKFLPNSNDTILVSAAADYKIRVHDLNSEETAHIFSCHAGRVKRIATAPNVPFLFWSAAEDGTIMQFDLRSPESSTSGNPQNVLINLNAYLGAQAEAKCLAINPRRPEQMAVGANDPYIRIYDRRMLSCKSIRFPSDPSARLPWEPRTMGHEAYSGDDYTLPSGCVNYYIAGHLPQKQADYRKRYRTLASTYLTYSPDGTELLVNLGGEQIYLFDVIRGRRPQRYDVPPPPGTNGVHKEGCNGYSLHRNGTNGVTNGISKHLTTPASASSASVSTSSSSSSSHASEGSKPKRHKSQSKPLPPPVEAIKQRANQEFEKQQYNRAILLYNQAISMVGDSPILYGNRAAAYMKRAWDGDLYAALRDCHSAMKLDSDHLKAHFRLARCLYLLSWTREAFDCLQLFKDKFPDYARSHPCEALDRDIKAAIFSRTENDSDSEPMQADQPDGQRRRKYDISEHEKQSFACERMWRAQAFDYEYRFCGHCNTTTDIKEANFFGSNGQYIVAGSDDGSFFIWEKRTTNIVRNLRGDDSIVNCLQPHPSHCLLATSGIDPVVRLWSPKPEDGKKEEREVDNSDDAASANQKRMNADPLEVMLMNMGYRITGVLDGDEEEEREGPVQCRPS